MYDSGADDDDAEAKQRRLFVEREAAYGGAQTHSAMADACRQGSPMRRTPSQRSNDALE